MVNFFFLLHLVTGRRAARATRPSPACGLLLLLLLALATTAQAQTTTFTYTGRSQTYTVPPGVTKLQVVAQGAAGGSMVGRLSAPGLGGRVQATVTVVPGEVLTVIVGGRGGDNTSRGGGGYNRGGQGNYAGGGGGATDLRRNPTVNRTGDYDSGRNALLVAGGGGGVGYEYAGGNGGNPNGGNGSAYPQYGGAGLGATTTAAGGGGSPGSNGNGGSGATVSDAGGGGGYYGGGGGNCNNNNSGASGGGGSSYVSPGGASFITYGPATTAAAGSLTLTPQGNNALHFDGTNDWGNTPSNAGLSSIASTITVEAWVRTTATGQRYIATKGDDSFYLGMNVDNATDGHAAFFLQGPSNSGGWLYGTSRLNDGQWHHVAGVYLGYALALYVDGIQESIRSASGSIRNGGTHSVNIGTRDMGAGATLSYFWQGDLDELRIYNTGLSSPQIRADRFNPAPVVPASLVLHYNFDQGTAASNNAGLTTLSDQSGSANTATLVNFAFTGNTSNFVRSFPTLLGLTPASGRVGTTITIWGTNLTDATRFVFNGTATAGFTAPTSDVEATLTVPADATTGSVSLTSATLPYFAGPTFTVSPNVVITTDSVSLALCAGAALSVPFTASGTFASGNVFSAQLSDAVGSFATPVTIGTLASTSAGTVAATVPVATAAGSSYRVRVVSSNPSVTGTDNGSAIVIGITALPTLTTLSPATGPVGTQVTLTGTSLTGATAVNFNGRAASSFTVNSATRITATVPAGATTGNATVTTPCGTSNGVAFTVVTPPANDDCANAPLLPVAATCTPTAGTTVGATQSLAAIVCGNFTGRADDDVWYKFVASAASQTVRVVSGGTSFDAVVDVRAGSCGNLTNIGCADATGPSGTEAVELSNLTPGSTYYVRVYSYGSVAGPFTICVTEPTTTAPTVTAPASNSTTNGLPTFMGTAPAGSTVTLYLAMGSGAAQAIGTATATGGTFTFTPSPALSSGTYSVYATAQSSGENGSNASATITFTVDATPPAVVSSMRQNPATNLTNAASLTFRVSFSEAVTGVTPGAFTLTSTGTATGSVVTVTAGGSASVYDVTVSGASGTGMLRLDLPSPAPGLTDLAGNPLAGSYTSGQAYTLDNTTPTATLSSPAGSATSTAPIAFTVTFSEVVTGFSASGISVTNGTLAGGLTSAGTTYSFNVTPTADGPVTVSVGAGAAQDVAGNPNPAAGPLRVAYQAPPTLTSLSSGSGPVGRQVTLMGQSLTGTTAVSFNNTAATTFAVVNATTVMATVPVGTTPGPVSITVTTPSGTSNALAFTVSSPPAVSTAAPSNLTPTSALLGGTVSTDGNDPVADRGVVYSAMNQTPTTADTKAVTAAGVGSFAKTVTGLTPATTYYVRAYATNGVGTSYGHVLALTTPCESPVLTVTDAQTLIVDAGQCSATRTFAAAATGPPAPTLSYAVGGMPVRFPYAFPVGTTTVTVTATNSCNDTDTKTFTVTVQDQQAPMARTQNVTVVLVNGQASLTAAQVNNGSADNCTSPQALGLRLDKTTFTCSNLGANPVTLTVTDASNNVSTATATVTVTGSVPQPAISVSPSTTIYLGYGPQTATLAASGGGPGATYQWSPAVGLSNPTSATATCTAMAAGSFPYTVTVTSASGCVASATVTLSVEDVQCGNRSDKVQVCHNGQIICVAPSAVSVHLAHGDQLGSCAAPRPAASLAMPHVASGQAVLEAYPNPFPNMTTVRFRVAQAGVVQLQVCNALGQVVHTLYHGTAQAGELVERTLDGTQLQAGLYTCRLLGSGQPLTQRLILTK